MRFNFHRTPSRDRTPWNIAQRHNRPAVVTQLRPWTQLREMLVPYLHQQTLAGITASLPSCERSPSKHPTTQGPGGTPISTYSAMTSLVAPVTEPRASIVDIYLPSVGCSR